MKNIGKIYCKIIETLFTCKQYTNNMLVTLMSYIFLTLIGFLFGNLLRYEHSNNPLNDTIVTIWPIFSIGGLMLTNMTPLFYLMTMVSIGWGAGEYILSY